MVILEKEGIPQYVMMTDPRYGMSQNYCPLEYAHKPCNENAQPQMRILNKTLYHDTTLTKRN